MFGTNPIRKLSRHPKGRLRVQEIFQTLQGEGPHAGRPAIFLRLAGCNLRCTFCDTDFESNYGRDPMVAEAVADIIFETARGMSNWILVITGGEPLLQNLEPLVSLMLGEGPRAALVQIETAGTVYDPSLDKFLTCFDYVVSPKTGKVASPFYSRSNVYWKYIVRAGDFMGTDGLPDSSTQVTGLKQSLARPCGYAMLPTQNRIYLQPCDEQDEQKNKNNVEEAIRRCKKYGYRLSLQQHKIINLP